MNKFNWLVILFGKADPEGVIVGVEKEQDAIDFERGYEDSSMLVRIVPDMLSAGAYQNAEGVLCPIITIDEYNEA